MNDDLKPRNVFLTQRGENGEPGPVKVIDFGLAKILDGQGSSRGSDGLLIGTPEYLAPEAWRGISNDIDARSDQWSLAVLTYRMLAGRMPFESSSDTVMLAREILGATPCPLRQLVADIPPAIEAAVTQALAKDKELRFRSVLDFIRALHGMPLSGAVQLRRDPATALLDNREFPTAAMADFREQPTTTVVPDYHERATSVPAANADQTTAMSVDCHNQATAVPVAYNDQPTAALALVDRSARITAASPRASSSTAVLLPTVPSSAPEITARLSAVPGLRGSAETPEAPYGPADSAQTPTRQHVDRSLRWQWFVIGVMTIAAVATHGLSRSESEANSGAAAPAAASELLVEPELPPLMKLAEPSFSSAAKIPAAPILEAGPSFAPGAPRPSALGVSVSKPRAKTMLPPAKKSVCTSQLSHSHLCRTGIAPHS